jgi:hypothetical protein
MCPAVAFVNHAGDHILLRADLGHLLLASLRLQIALAVKHFQLMTTLVLLVQKL